MAGRPKKGDDDRRSNVLRIRLTDDERQILNSVAKSEALDVSAWARTMLLSNRVNHISIANDAASGRNAVKSIRRRKPQ